VADRLRVDTAPLHLGGVRFPVTGPVRYTMTAKDAVELRRLINPRTSLVKEGVDGSSPSEGLDYVQISYFCCLTWYRRAPPYLKAVSL
jgi:hypothetical protein